MANIQVDTTKLRECGNDIAKLVVAYREAVSMLYSRINNMPVNSLEWVGDSATNFANQVLKDKVKYDNLGNVLVSYANYLTTTAVKIERANNKVAK